MDCNYLDLDDVPIITWPEQEHVSNILVKIELDSKWLTSVQIKESGSKYDKDENYKQYVTVC